MKGKSVNMYAFLLKVEKVECVLTVAEEALGRARGNDCGDYSFCISCTIFIIFLLSVYCHQMCFLSRSNSFREDDTIR